MVGLTKCTGDIHDVQVVVVRCDDLQGQHDRRGRGSWCKTFKLQAVGVLVPKQNPSGFCFPLFTNLTHLLRDEEATWHDAVTILVPDGLKFIFINYQFNGIRADQVANLGLLGLIEELGLFWSQLLFIKLLATLLSEVVQRELILHGLQVEVGVGVLEIGDALDISDVGHHRKILLVTPFSQAVCLPSSKDTGTVGHSIICSGIIQ